MPVITPRSVIANPEAPLPFLAPEPPRWAARGLAYFLILLCVTAAVVAALLHVPETASGAFVLVPLQGTDPVRAAHNGIVAAVQVAEGEMVSQGAALFVIHSQVVGERSAALRTLEAQRQGAMESRNNARDTYSSQQGAKAEEIRRLEGQLTALRSQIEQHRNLQRMQQEQYQISHDLLAREGASRSPTGLPLLSGGRPV